jgi:hypothetical protein
VLKPSREISRVDVYLKATFQKSPLFLSSGSMSNDGEGDISETMLFISTLRNQVTKDILKHLTMLFRLNSLQSDEYKGKEIINNEDVIIWKTAPTCLEKGGTDQAWPYS